jgi:hypothetical protein
VQAKLALDTYVKLMSSRFVLNVELGLIEKDARGAGAPLKKGEVAGSQRYCLPPAL